MQVFRVGSIGNIVTPSYSDNELNSEIFFYWETRFALHRHLKNNLFQEAVRQLEHVAKKAADAGLFFNRHEEVRALLKVYPKITYFLLRWTREAAAKGALEIVENLIVMMEKDAAVARTLAREIGYSFKSVFTVEELAKIHHEALSKRYQMAIKDLENYRRICRATQMEICDPMVANHLIREINHCAGKIQKFSKR